jgi:hypothetical protein
MNFDHDAALAEVCPSLKEKLMRRLQKAALALGLLVPAAALTERQLKKQLKQRGSKRAKAKKILRTTIRSAPFPK